MPPDRAVAVRCDDDAPIPAGVDRPNLVSARPTRFLRSRIVERGEGVARAKKEAFRVPSDRQAARDVVLCERKHPTVQRGTGSVPPTVNCQAFAVRRKRQTVVRRRTRQCERPHVESQHGPRQFAIAEVDNLTVLGHAHDVGLLAIIEDGRWDCPNRFALRIHEAEARRRRSDKDPPVRQGVDAGGRIGSAVGHAPLVAQAAPVPGKKEASILRVIHCAICKQRLTVARPCDVYKSVPRRGGVRRALPALAREGLSTQDINRRDVVVADRQPFAVWTECDAAREMSGRRWNRLTDAAKVWALVRWVVFVETDQSVKGRRRETAVARERRAITMISVWGVAECHLPIPSPVQDPQAIAIAERGGEITAIGRKCQGTRDVWQIVVNAPNEISGFAVEEVDRVVVALNSLRPAAGRDRRSVRADRHCIDPSNVLWPDRYPDRAQQLAVGDRPDSHRAIVTASHGVASLRVDRLRSDRGRMHAGIDGEHRAVVQVRSQLRPLVLRQSRREG